MLLLLALGASLGYFFTFSLFIFEGNFTITSGSSQVLMGLPVSCLNCALLAVLLTFQGSYSGFTCIQAFWPGKST